MSVEYSNNNPPCNSMNFNILSSSALYLCVLSAHHRTDDWLQSVWFQVRSSGLVWLLYKCAALWRAVHGALQLKDPLELCVKVRNFFPVPSCHLEAYELSLRKRGKKHSFLLHHPDEYHHSLYTFSLFSIQCFRKGTSIFITLEWSNILITVYTRIYDPVANLTTTTTRNALALE